MQLRLSGPFYGVLTTPLGFALNSRKCVTGLLEVGLKILCKLMVTPLLWRLQAQEATIIYGPLLAKLSAGKIVIATNESSREDLPNLLSSCFIPVQSSIILTLQMTQNELNAQVWSSDQMAYDKRKNFSLVSALTGSKISFWHGRRLVCNNRRMA